MVELHPVVREFLEVNDQIGQRARLDRGWSKEESQEHGEDLARRTQLLADMKRLTSIPISAGEAAK